MSFLNFEFMVGTIPIFFEALLITLKVSFFGILFSVVVGFFSALVMFYKVRFLQTIVSVYIELSRNTPLIVQLFFLYYGLPQIGIKIDVFTCAVAGLTFLGGSYMSESFRAGLNSVSKTQIEAGLSIGLNKIALIWYVVLPQALPSSIPALSANAIFLLKETSVVSVIALADLMFVTYDLITSTYKTNEVLVMLVLSYLVVLLPLSFLFSILEKRFRYVK